MSVTFMRCMSLCRVCHCITLPVKRSGLCYQTTVQNRRGVHLFYFFPFSSLFFCSKWHSVTMYCIVDTQLGVSMSPPLSAWSLHVFLVSCKGWMHAFFLTLVINQCSISIYSMCSGYIERHSNVLGVCGFIIMSRKGAELVCATYVQRM